MSRLQKKCFIGATGMHVLLLVVLVVGPAFFIAEKMDDAPLLEIIPDITTDIDAKGGGGKPSPQQPTPPPAQPPEQKVVQSQPEPPTLAVKQVQKTQPVKESEPVKETRNDDALELNRKPHKVQVSSTVVKIKDRSSTPSTSTADKPAEAKATAERQRFASAAKALRSNLSQTTTIETPRGGFGGDGPSYANYKQVVRKIYNDAWNAWSVPDDVTDDEAAVQVKVTIARNGRVVKSEIVRSSGSSAVVNAARAVLDRVTYVKEFPADSKDTERTFIMTLKLNAKKLG
ncbi:MAG TPA: TonB C-terminal domain-containing protein [Verrucomicrobiae bacterium]|nr:TonB C-terminal domain-containing protein [Verrucomicrobiae bacterium]